MIQLTLPLILLFLFFPVPLPAASDLERMVLQELNVARTNPDAYASHLRHYRSLFTGVTYTQPGTGQLIRTEEGTTAIDEAIAVLQRQKPLAPLKWSDGLARSGAELVKVQSKSGDTGHGSGKFSMERRIKRHGRWTVAIGENVTYGPYVAERGRDVVTQLIVDDGVPSRGHRKTIYDADFRLAGVSCGPHPTYEIACVIDFAGGSEPEQP